MSSSVLRLPGLLLAGCALVASGSAVWKVARAPLLTQLAEQDAAYTREKLRTYERAAEVLKAAAERGDQLTTALELHQAQVNKLTREKRDAIHQVTSGRPCLGQPALRLLDNAPGLSVRGLAPATSSTAATGSAAATDTDDGAVSSTDADIASWVIDAGAQYAVCSARLDALIDWHIEEKKTP
jgi:hypothetical protein